MSERDQVRTNRTAILRVRSLGYTGRELDVAGTSLPSQKEKSVLPEEVEHWSLTTLREKLNKIGAKIVRHDQRRFASIWASRQTSYAS